MNKQRNILRMTTLVISSLGLIFSVSCEQQEDPNPPTACFSTDGNQFTVGETIVFDNCSENAKNYAWDFGDGSTSSKIEPTHSYTEPDEYVVTLRALNRELYDEDTKILYISPSNNSLEACFTASSTSVETGQSIIFTNCSINAQNYSWSFGDGSTSTVTNPSHTYNSSGKFTVVLTASNNDNTDTYQIQITVTESSTNLTACFTYSPTTIEQGQTVSFTNCSTNATSYSWTFGDGSTSSTSSPTHIFNEAGDYTVSLTASNGSETDTETKQITVNESSANTVAIEFYVDMSIEYLWGRFDFDNDYVDVAGTFNDWGDGTQFKLVYTEVDGYWGTILTGFEVGQTIEFKFRINGNWETAEFPGGSNRSYTVQEGENVIMVPYNDVNQVIVDQYDYYGVPINSFQDYIIDEFDSAENTYFYVTSNSEVTSTINGGIYTVTNHTEGSDYLMWSGEIGPDESLNYQYETEMSITDYNDTYGSGLIWGKNPDAFEYYYMFLSPDAYYINGYFKSEWVSWIDWTKGGLASPNTNKITVRKLATKYYIFINEIFVQEQDVEPFFGHVFGLSVGPLITAEFEYYHAKLIDLNFTKSTVEPKHPSSTNSGSAKTMNSIRK